MAPRPQVHDPESGSWGLKAWSAAVARLWHLVSLLLVLGFSNACFADTTITVTAAAKPSTVFLKPGQITTTYSAVVNHDYLARGEGNFEPGGASDGAIFVSIKDVFGRTLVAQQVQVLHTRSSNIAEERTPDQSVVWTNPTAQFVDVSAYGTILYASGNGRTNPARPTSGEYFETTVAAAKTVVSGGDDPNGGVPTVPGGSPSVPVVATKAAREVHAMIISGASTVSEAVNLSNCRLVGGLALLGRRSAQPPPSESTWPSGLTIVADPDLLRGRKVPPITPNLIDVRIVRDRISDQPSP